MWGSCLTILIVDLYCFNYLLLVLKISSSLYFQEKLKERERALRKRKEREEQEVERVRQKARRKEAVESYQALLVEIIKDPQVLFLVL